MVLKQCSRSLTLKEVSCLSRKLKPKAKTKAIADAVSTVVDLTTLSQMVVEHCFEEPTALSARLDNETKKLESEEKPVQVSAIRKKHFAEFNAEEKDLLESNLTTLFQLVVEHRFEEPTA